MKIIWGLLWKLLNPFKVFIFCIFTEFVTWFFYKLYCRWWNGTFCCRCNHWSHWTYQQGNCKYPCKDGEGSNVQVKYVFSCFPNFYVVKMPKKHFHVMKNFSVIQNFSSHSSNEFQWGIEGLHRKIFNCSLPAK